MMETFVTSEAEQRVRRHLIVIGATASEIDSSIQRSHSCLDNLKAASASFDELAMAEVSEPSEASSADLLQVSKDPLLCAAERSVELMAESARHLKSLDSFARAAEAAINQLEHDLQQLADAVTRDPTLACSASALHMEATGIVSACGAWVHVSASLARRLARECELMQARLQNHARCSKLALSAMQKAKHQAKLIQ